MLDRLPEIAKSYSLHASSLQPTGNLVLIETNPREGMIGSLHIPIESLEAYPTSGWIHAIGPDITEELKVGDFVLIEEEGLSLEHSYYDVFEVTLRHDSGEIEDILVEIEVEPVLREQVNTYRRGGDDTVLSMIDKKNGGSISFNCSNVVSYQFGQAANPRYNITYVPVYMYVLPNDEDTLTLFYLTSEDRILMTLEYEVG